ncbi:MAG: phage portal protein [Azonexus sp.]|nr:phage portal protein [Azonexus sp.]
MKFTRIVSGFFGGISRALAAVFGKQSTGPVSSLVDDLPGVSVDKALQLSAVWACVERIAKTIASLPLFVYDERGNGLRELARESSLWKLLHDSPNSRMTPFEFWVAMIINLLLRGNAYARIDRGQNGEAYSLQPMPADQVEVSVLEDGAVVYHYRIGSDVAVIAEENILHLKEMGNGTVGLARLDFMRASTVEAGYAQTTASKLFVNGGKPSGVLMIDRVLKPEQRDAIKKNFVAMSEGGTSRLFVLEADMKYQQITLNPEQLQLLETRQFGVEEIARWFGVPAVLINHANVTTWGSGIEQIVEGFVKFTIAPALVSFQQAIRKRVMTPAQRSRQTVEFSLDALLRSNLKDRMAIYAAAVQNGIYTRAEVRQLENMPPIAGSDQLTAQTNLAPLEDIGDSEDHAGESDATAQIPTAQ